MKKFATCLTVPALLAVLASAPAAQGRDSVEGSVREILVQRWLLEDWSDERVVGELAGLGPRAIPVLFDTLVDVGTIVPEELQLRGHALDGGPALFHVLVREALGAMSRRDVIAHLRTRAATDPSFEERLAILAVLGEVGGHGDLPLFFHTLSSFDGVQLGSNAIAPAVAAAAPAVLGDPALEMSDIAYELDRFAKPQLAPAVEALAAVEHPGVFLALATALGRDKELDAQLIGRLADLRERHPWRTAEHADVVTERIESFLLEEDWQLRKAGVVALARMHALDSLDELIHMATEDRHQSVRRAATWSLRYMSGTARTFHAVEWADWFAAERKRWQEESPALFEELQSEDPHRALEAARGLARHTVRRHEVAERMPRVLLRHPVLTQSICDLLVDLGSRRAAPVLIELMVDADEPQRLILWRALRRITGEDFPLDLETWEGYVWG